MKGRQERWERERRLQTTCMLIITTILLGAVCYQMSTVLIPFVLALFIFQLLDPVVNTLTIKMRLPHWLAVTVTLGFTVFGILIVSSIVTSSFSELLDSSDTYVQKLDTFLEQMSARFPFIGKKFQILTQGQFEQFGAGIGSFLAALTNSIIYVLSQSTVVILFLMFLLFGSNSAYEEIPGVLGDINRKVKKYIQVKTAVSLANGILAGLILWLLNIELAVVFGLLTVVLNFIPNVGSIIATLLPLPMILVSPNVTTTEAILAFVIPGIIHFFVGNILEPQLLGDTMDMSPVVVLLSLTVWTALWGGIGALLAVPITAVIQILCDRLDFTRPIAQLLRGNFLELLGAHKIPTTEPVTEATVEVSPGGQAKVELTAPEPAGETIAESAQPD